MMELERSRIGIVGGGQLGRMLTEAALPLGFEVTVIDPAENCPAAQAGAEQIPAALTDVDAIHELAARTDVVTWEIEHINAEALAELETPVEPSPMTLLTIKDKLRQKEMLKSAGIPVADFMPVDSYENLLTAFGRFRDGVIVKTRTGGYDGRGNLVVSSPADWQQLQETFGDTPLYAEEIEPFQKELAILVARNTEGQSLTYPVVETIHKNNICHLVVAPAPIDRRIEVAAEEIARETVGRLEGAGVFAIEMFLTEDNEVLVNEIAPRVHNSGHHTIEANRTSQFEQHIRAITGLPLGSTEMVAPAAAMINILGERDGEVRVAGLEKVLEMPDVHVHLYGKSPTKVARKMGHITVRGNFIEQVKHLAVTARKEITI